MDRTLLRRLQKISYRNNMDQTEVANEFIGRLAEHLKKRGYRADLSLATDAKVTSGTFTASVKFDPALGRPEETDLMSLVAQSYPKHQIDWELVQLDSEHGVALIPLEPSVEVVPVHDMQSIPPEFKPIGTALYKRAADASGKVHEIWTLKKNQNGLALYRAHDDIEVQAEEEGFKATDIVNTPHGPGRIVRFDESGNAFVQVGNQKRLVAREDMQPYKIEKEKKKLQDLYTQIYGDAEFASKLVEDYGRKDSR